MYDILDDSREAEEYRRTEKQNVEQKILDYHDLVNRVFGNEDGERLLAIWIEENIFKPTVIAGDPIEANGIREGKAEFVRTIFGIIELIKNNYYQKEDNSNE